MKARKPVDPGRLRVLFILHQASLTGAPIILVELARAMLRRNGYRGEFLVVEDGPLLDRCRAVAETHVWMDAKKAAQWRQWGILGRVAGRLYRAWNELKITRVLRGTDVVISNTIANGAILDRLSFLRSPVISYIHELPFAVSIVTNPVTLGHVLRCSDRFVAGSEAVRQYLVDGLGVRKENTCVIYSSLPTRSFSEETIQAWKRRFRNDHHVPANALVIGVASAAEWRKGFDLWFPLIMLIRRRFPEEKVVFVWKGYRGSPDRMNMDMFDFRKSGIEDSVILLPHDGESLQTIAAFDIHLLLSREDPYPLVVLEAACMGIPTVCFADAGGTPEFVEEDAGICVPYGDLEAMADSLGALLGKPELARSLGENARRKVFERHDVEQAASRMDNIVRDALKEHQGIASMFPREVDAVSARTKEVI